MVPNAEVGGIFEVRALDEERWARILEGGIERSIETEFDAHGQRIPPLRYMMIGSLQWSGSCEIATGKIDCIGI
jgi:hypothetical protein